MPKRRYSSAFIRSTRRYKRAKRGINRLQSSMVASRRAYRRRTGFTGIVHKFHRYGTSITANYPANYFDASAGNLPFNLYPIAGYSYPTWPIAYQFSIGDVGNVTEFSNLFDSYMITGVACYVKLVLNPDSTGAQGAAGGPPIPIYPILWYLADQDDANTTDVAALKECERVKRVVLNPNRSVKIYVPYPKISSEVLGAGAVRSAGIDKAKWLDFGYTDVVHYGLKMALDFQGVSPSASYPFRVKLDFKYYFKCKDTR